MRILISASLLFLFTPHCEAITELTEQYGVIESPGYPQTYSNNEDLSWRITTEPGYQIVVYFSEFDLEDSYDEEMGGACVYDYIQVEHKGTIRRLCGNEKEFPSDAPRIWQEFRSENNTTLIRFVSDYSNEDSQLLRFRAHYRVEDRDECAEMERERRTVFEDWDELVYCNHFCVNVPGSYYCTCRAGFELHENRHTCKGSCENQLLTFEDGVISSPDFPHTYSRLTECDWTIQVRAGLALNLQFDETFEIEDHYNYTECLYDWLKLSYGGNEEMYCHGVPNNGSVIYTNVREVRLEFHTDNAIEMAGFKLTYTTIRQKCLESRDAPFKGYKNRNRKSYYEFEDMIEFECAPGYNLIGERRIKCQHDGSWSHPVPVCQIKVCGPPAFLGNVSYSNIVNVSEYNFTFGDVITLECWKWYEMVSGRPQWKCAKEASWQPLSRDGNGNDIPVCKPVCGVKNGAVRPLFGMFIAGGMEASRHEWPWMVFLNLGYRARIGAREFTCGGALISPDYVLTAAHCVTGMDRDYPPDGVRFSNHTHVWLGAHNRLMDHWRNNSNVRYAKVDRVIRHPRYHEGARWNYDVALLKLSQTVLMDDYVRPICLPTTTEEHEAMIVGNTTGEVAGWGLSKSSGRPSYVLLYAELPSVTSTACWRNFLKVANLHEKVLSSQYNITENMFCAGHETGDSADSCKGDSGGPYMVLNPNEGRYFAHGLVSWGLSLTECGESLSYSVFSYINPEISNWIQENMD